MTEKSIHNTRFDFPHLDVNQEGDVIIIDKPVGCTSFDVVNKIKNQLRHTFDKKIKVGHAGTLDPLASGVLIVCIGAYTKKIDQYQSSEKEYIGTFEMGATTPGFDKEKPIDQIYPYDHISLEMAEKAATSFLGEIEQVPPLYSAVRVDGKRAFHYAREGTEVALTTKIIHISTFEITRFALPEIDFRIVCSKGTYIRSIARDFGLHLNSGSHISALRRTRIGQFRVEEAMSIVEIRN